MVLIMVRVGEQYTVEVQEQKIKVQIVEVIPYRTPTRRRALLIGYRIIDENFESPTAHFWMYEGEDIRGKIREVVDFYLKVRDMVRRT